MKVTVITRHAITNYGSLLQTVATQQVIESFGHSCEIIDYVRADELYSQHEKTILKRKAKWNNNVLKRIVYLMIRQPESIVAGKKFEKFQSEYLHLTKRYTSLEQLETDIPLADVYMTGSDQVWGPVENGEYDSSYCLSFVPDNKKKIAYAASFGKTKLNDELCTYYKKWLSEYACIAVREDSALKLLEDIELQASQVLDPTLLLDFQYWKKYLKPIKHKRYVLVYQVHNDKTLGEYAQKVAKDKGLELIRLSVAFHQIVRPGKFVYLPEVGEFLSYIRDAECMITDSFHGTAFAINFNTPFVEVLPNNDTGTRNMSILNLTGLSDRILKDVNDIELASQNVDFSFANKILEEKRIESIRIFRNMFC